MFKKNLQAILKGLFFLGPVLISGLISYDVFEGIELVGTIALFIIAYFAIYLVMKSKWNKENKEFAIVSDSFILNRRVLFISVISFITGLLNYLLFNANTYELMIYLSLGFIFLIIFNKGPAKLLNLFLIAYIVIELYIIIMIAMTVGFELSSMGSSLVRIILISRALSQNIGLLKNRTDEEDFRLGLVSRTSVMILAVFILGGMYLQFDAMTNKAYGDSVLNWKVLYTDGYKEIEIDDGSRYVGNIKNGEFHGEGVYYFADGAVYTGAFEKGYFCGNGKLTMTDGTVYIGEFKDDFMHGFGEISTAQGNTYRGTFKMGVIEGNGILYWSDGSRYEGEFKDGYEEGFGTIYLSDGTKQSGYWHEGNYIGTEPST